MGFSREALPTFLMCTVWISPSALLQLHPFSCHRENGGERGRTAF